MLLSNLNLLATAPGGVARLRELILTLAVQGKLLAQDPGDEAASVLLEKIRAEKDRLIAAGKIKRDKPLAAIAEGEKPFEIPNGWEWVPLSELLPEFQNGASSRGDVGGKSVTVLRLADIKNRRVSLADTRQIPIVIRDIQKYQLNEGDILITRVNGSADIVGQFNLCDVAIDAIYCDHFIRMRVNSQWLEPTFSALLSESSLIRQRIKKLFITTAGQKTVNQGHISSLQFGLPPLAEQSRIVARVEELMRLCDALETKGQLEAAQHAQLVATLLGTLADSETPDALAQNWQRIASHFDLLLDRPQAVDALEQSILQLAVRGLLVPQDPGDEPASALLQKIRAEKDRLIAEGKIKRDKPLPPVAEDEKPFALPQGWAWARFGDVALISSGITLGRKTAIPSPVFLPYLRVANVQRWHLNLSSIKEVVIDQTELARFQLCNGDLLITEGGDWDKVGRTAIWRDELPTCLHQNHVFKARGTSSDWNPVWAEMYLNSMIARTYFASSAKQTTNLASINMTQLKNCMFPLPPLPEQARIVARVQALRGLCADLRQRLAASRAAQAQLAEALVSQPNG